MGPEHVAHGLRVSYGLPYVGPDLVVAWERGDAVPDARELAALAGVLWCSPADLTGRPRSLGEYRVARGLAPEDVARAVGIELHAYLRMEEARAWRGTARQSAALAALLGLSPADQVTVTGHDDRLAELLRGAVTNRWQGYVRQVAKVVPLDRRVLEDVLAELHQEYRAHRSAGRDVLDRVLDHFWTRVDRDTDHGHGPGHGPAAWQGAR
jgi:transcriptional regulator with XRE-family HTH domain